MNGLKRTECVSRRAALRCAQGLFAAALVAVLAACSTQEAGSIDTAAGAIKSIGMGVAPRLSKETLEKHGLEELWYVPSIDGGKGRAVGAQRAFLLAEGLFVVTLVPGRGSDSESGPTKHLIRFQRKNGQPAWYEPIDSHILHAPTAYTYPTGIDAEPELFYQQDDKITCLDLEGGNRKWSVTAPFPVATGLASTATLLLMGGEDQRLHSLTKNSTATPWSYVTGGSIDVPPVVSGDEVIVASQDGAISGMPAGRGWEPGNSWTFYAKAPVRTELVTYNRSIYAGSLDYKLYCLRADGSVSWAFQAEAPVVDAPVIYNYRPNRDYCFCLATDRSKGDSKRLFAVPLPRGDIVARVDADWYHDNVLKVVSIGRDNLYVLLQPSSRGERLLAAIDLATGKERFTIDIQGFNFVPTNSADFGRDKRERGVIYLVSETGALQAIRERL